MLRCALPPSKRVALYVGDDTRFDQAKADFRASRKTEKQFAIRLRKIARHIGQVVSEMSDGSLASSLRIGELMARYSEAIAPWAQAVATRMHAEIAARDKRTWQAYARQMGTELRREIDDAPTGDAMRKLMSEQVTLIKSLPVEAAERVHKLTLEGISEGTRYTEIIDEIMRTGEVTESRATLIARTEVARTASVLTQARAQWVGSDGYIWRTARDGAVRPSHKKLDGKFIRWDDPPECDPGYHAHAGQIFNCRCICLPQLPLD